MEYGEKEIWVHYGYPNILIIILFAELIAIFPCTLYRQDGSAQTAGVYSLRRAISSCTRRKIVFQTTHLYYKMTLFRLGRRYIRFILNISDILLTFAIEIEFVAINYRLGGFASFSRLNDAAASVRLRKISLIILEYHEKKPAGSDR